MAKPKIRTQKSGTGPKPKSGGRGPGGGKREREALRGMLIGMVIIAAAAGFFMLPIGGRTSFSHLIHALGLQGGDDDTKTKVKTPSETNKTETKPQGARATTPAATRQAAARTPTAPRPVASAVRPVRPAGLKIAENAARGAPLERATAADDAALDRLVREHSGN